jgi:hypothetical protein
MRGKAQMPYQDQCAVGDRHQAAIRRDIRNAATTRVGCANDDCQISSV